ncbi:MAG: D-glycero-alpha-D-manno-heptose-1,7-bisphosphate 7-phosphatase [Patescibacteria group bacterium]
MNKAFFLDRDGVINKKPKPHDYVKTFNEFELLPTTIDAIKLINSKGYKVIVITNQRGIALNLVSSATVNNIHKSLDNVLAENGIVIDSYYICPHNHEHKCYCRKPNPGMLFKAILEHNINITKSFLIGDSDTDILCGELVGIKSVKIKSNASLLNAVRKLLKENDGV